MTDDDDRARPFGAASSGPFDPVESCTLIVRLRSGIELEYDLDPRRWPLLGR